MTNITVERYSEDGLSAKSWVFWYYELRHTLYLDHYYEMSRPTKRHKLSVDENYNRLMARSSSRHLDQVEIPDDVIEEARRLFVELAATVKIEKWK